MLQNMLVVYGPFDRELDDKNIWCVQIRPSFLSAQVCNHATLTHWNQVEHIDELVQERRNSIANTLELRLSCTNPSLYASVNWVIIDLCNGLWPVGHEALI